MKLSFCFACSTLAIFMPPQRPFSDRIFAQGTPRTSTSRVVEPARSECSPGGSSLRSLALTLNMKHRDASDFVRVLDGAVGVDSKFVESHSAMKVFSSD